MKRGSTQRQKTKPITLTLLIARKICTRIESGLPLYSRNSKYLLVNGVEIYKNTYQSWIRSGIVPADVPKGHSLSQMVAKAKLIGERCRSEAVLTEGNLIKVAKLISNSLTARQLSIRRYSNKSVVECVWETELDPSKLNIQSRASEIILDQLYFNV